MEERRNRGIHLNDTKTPSDRHNRPIELLASGSSARPHVLRRKNRMKPFNDISRAGSAPLPLWRTLVAGSGIAVIILTALGSTRTRATSINFQDVARSDGGNAETVQADSETPTSTIDGTKTREGIVVVHGSLNGNVAETDPWYWRNWPQYAGFTSRRRLPIALSATSPQADSAIRVRSEWKR